ncbi:MAG: MotA/TolQ/ExbB proton channel family protein [Pseudomonadota bacterium]
MKHSTLTEFLYQLIALFVALIFVHAIYIAIVRPNAESLLEAQRISQAAGEAFEVERSFYVVIKDYEQEACFVLMLWATAIMGFKMHRTLGERRLLTAKFIEIPSGTKILPEDARRHSRSIESVTDTMREALLPRALLAGLRRFGSSQDVSNVSDAVREVCETEAERLDTDLSMIRYIVWAIPSIGFIGTVRGIGQALGQAHRAVEGDIVGVTTSLGVAFNSTFIALVISLFVMFLMHQLQLLQERLVLDTQSYCDINLLRHLATR